MLDDGWKTYWRTPGDGLPPSIEWKNSENLQDAELLWPVPQRHESPGGLTSFGYEKRLVLPLLITPGDKTKPVHLKLQAVYGVCADICIPVETSLSLIIPPSGVSAHKGPLMATLERVPKRQRRGVYCPHSFITAKRRDANDKPALLIKTAFEEQATGLDLFAEAPDGFELPAPAKQPRSARGRLYYVIAFDEAQGFEDLKGQPLTLTTVSDQGSCETVWRMK
jgi:DsbC/DsbD-like thiol-disulfide interchange protein